MIFVATAGWSIPRSSAEHFPGEGTHLQRYAQIMRGVEVNSSFYRLHKIKTYAAWAAQTPRHFRFAVKIPRTITHDARLRSTRPLLDEFLESIAGLGHRLGPLIVQLPPSLAFEPSVVRRFFGILRERYEGFVVCEPRHASWFASSANALLERYHVGRVAADPAVVPDATAPGGWSGIAYYRLHGSPRKYWSVYEQEQVRVWGQELKALPRATSVWCVFDNTASGGAALNALQMRNLLERGVPTLWKRLEKETQKGPRRSS